MLTRKIWIIPPTYSVSVWTSDPYDLNRSIKPGCAVRHSPVFYSSNANKKDKYNKLMALKNITREMVLDAFQEFDRLGLCEMLNKYGGKCSKCWYISFDGKYYDQKVTLRAAHEAGGLGNLPPGQGTFTARDARKHLGRLGFQVHRNPM